MAERIGVLTNGRLVAEGNLAELRLRAGRGGSLEDVFLTLVGDTAAA
jgi:ABC-2 type transport system ATP-binding protein